MGFRLPLSSSSALLLPWVVFGWVQPMLAQSSLQITPASCILSQGASQQFNIPPAQASTFQWSVEPSSMGSISITGLFTASLSASGPGRVLAVSKKNPSQKFEAMIEVIVSKWLEVFPASVSLATKGEQLFQVIFHGEVGNPEFQWSLIKPGFGTIAVLGNTLSYKAPDIPGSNVLQVTSLSDSSLSAQAVISVILSRPELIIQPRPVALEVGDQQTFQALLDGAEMLRTTWSCDRGTIQPSTGVYRAPNTLGAVKITASVFHPQTGEEIRASLNVDILPKSCTP